MKEHLLPSKQRYDTSEFDGDAKRAVAALERRLFDALTELKGLRPLRREAAELPILQGKLRRATEGRGERVADLRAVGKKTRSGKCDSARLQAPRGPGRRRASESVKLNGSSRTPRGARYCAARGRRVAQGRGRVARIRELSKTQQRQLDPEAETLATTGPSRRRSPSPAVAEPVAREGGPVEDGAPARRARASPAGSDASGEERDASPGEPESPKRDASPARAESPKGATRPSASRRRSSPSAPRSRHAIGAKSFTPGRF